MPFTVEEQGEITIIRIQEERLDAHSSPALKGALHDLQASGKTQFVIDLTHVQFMDSSGLGALVSGFKNLRSVNGDMKLSSIASPVEAIFKLTRLYRVFPIYQNLTEALNSFGDSAEHHEHT